MNIQSISATPYNYQNKSTPTFGAIHPCLYYVKVGDGSYKMVTDGDLIKNTLQKKIITWLNHNYNKRMKMAQGSSVKARPETPATKALRERLTRFFINRDEDYRTKGQDRAASYFNTDMTTGLVRPYIFTGRSVSVLDSCAERIKQVQSQIKRLTEDLQCFYGHKYADAKAKATSEFEPELMAAKAAYHETVMELLRSPAAKSDPKNTVFSAFFEETTKGKKKSYTLVNANFEQRLV